MGPGAVGPDGSRPGRADRGPTRRRPGDGPPGAAAVGEPGRGGPVRPVARGVGGTRLHHPGAPFRPRDGAVVAGWDADRARRPAARAEGQHPGRVATDGTGRPQPGRRHHPRVPRPDRPAPLGGGVGQPRRPADRAPAHQHGGDGDRARRSRPQLVGRADTSARARPARGRGPTPERPGLERRSGGGGARDPRGAGRPGGSIGGGRRRGPSGRRLVPARHVLVGQPGRRPDRRRPGDDRPRHLPVLGGGSRPARDQRGAVGHPRIGRGRDRGDRRGRHPDLQPAVLRDLGNTRGVACPQRHLRPDRPHPLDGRGPRRPGGPHRGDRRGSGGDERGHHRVPRRAGHRATIPPTAHRRSRRGSCVELP